MTTLVIPDTNILYSDPFLEKPLVKTIMAAEERAGLKLVIPEVVVDELHNCVAKRLDEIISAGEKASREFSELSGRLGYQGTFRVSDMERRAVLDRFERRINQLDQEGRIRKYPCVSSAELAQRSIKQQLPFQDKDRGMRDTLIWLTVKELLLEESENTRRLIFLTKDKRAFLDDNKIELHEGLKKELQIDDIPEDLVIVQQSFRDVIARFISSKLSDNEFVSAAFKGGQIKDFADRDHKIALMARDWILEHGSIFDGIYVGRDYDDIDFDGLSDVLLENVEETLALDSGQVSVSSVWSGKAELVISVDNFFEESLWTSVRFRVSSIVQVNDEHVSVQSDEIIDVQAYELTDVGDTSGYGHVRVSLEALEAAGLL